MDFAENKTRTELRQKSTFKDVVNFGTVTSRIFSKDKELKAIWNFLPNYLNATRLSGEAQVAAERQSKNEENNILIGKTTSKLVVFALFKLPGVCKTPILDWLVTSADRAKFKLNR
jgi:hypothetical protein